MLCSLRWFPGEVSTESREWILGCVLQESQTQSTQCTKCSQGSRDGRNPVISNYKFLFAPCGFPGGTGGKEPACQRRRYKRLVHGVAKESDMTKQLNNINKSTLNNVNWRATVHRVTRGQTRLKQLSTQARFAPWLWILHLYLSTEQGWIWTEHPCFPVGRRKQILTWSHPGHLEIITNYSCVFQPRYQHDFAIQLKPPRTTRFPICESYLCNTSFHRFRYTFSQQKSFLKSLRMLQKVCWH